MAQSRTFSLKNVTFDLTRLVRALPILSAVVGIVLVIGLRRDEQAAQHAALTNQLSDRLLVASAEAAKERGATAILLSDTNPNLEDLNRLTEIRSAGDAGYRQALDVLDAMLALRDDNGELALQRDALLEERHTFEKARERVDFHARDAGSAEAQLSSAAWVGIATNYIDAQSRVRMASTRASEGAQLATYANLRIKQPIFVAAEFAGRERAILGAHIRENKPIAAKTREQLLVYRGLVDEAIRNVVDLKSAPNLEENLRQAINGMERNFLGTWEIRRRQILATPAESTYPIDAQQWYNEATQGIDSILAVGQTASATVVSPLEDEVKNARLWLWLGTAGLIAFVGLAQLGAMALTRRVRVALVGPIENAFASLDEQAAYLKRASTELGDASQSVAAAAHEQASAVQETVASMAQMDSVLAQTSTHARDSREIARAVTQRSEAGKVAMEKMVEAVAAIQSAADHLGKMDSIIENIGGRTAIINDIVFKTQLLSFNASIEAARAGQHGRGFAVVAEEIGNLAQTSGNAAKEIQVMLADSQRQVLEILEVTRTRVRDGHTVASDAKAIFNQIAQEIASVSHQVQSIADASKEQEIGSRQISQAMSKMEEIMHRNNIAAQHASRMAAELRGHSETLTQTTIAAQSLVLGESTLRTLPTTGGDQKPSGDANWQESNGVASARANADDAHAIANRLIEQRGLRRASHATTDPSNFDANSSDFDQVA
jgi:methyl-accepting chemotaxis protein